MIMEKDRMKISGEPCLDNRLACAASMVRDNAVVADIGTDHAYLPVYLLKTGKISRAVASDINIGPLRRAMLNAEKYGVAEQISFIQSDGLQAVDAGGEAVDCVDDIVICGMGGELIAKIINTSRCAKKSGVRLILQPMSSVYELRAYLADSGFCITDERLCKAGGKIYTCMCAHYDGLRREFSVTELLLGKRNIENGDLLFSEYAEQILKKLGVRIAGLERGGHDAAAVRACFDEIEKIIKTPKTNITVE